MTDLTIRRLSVTARAGGGSPDAGRLDRLLRGVAGHRLEQAVRTAGLPEGTWCLRRLDVPVQLDPARPDSALETAWAAALVAAVRTAIGNGSPEAVRYADERDAVLDLVCSTASGRTERIWAWRQLGLVRAGEPAPDRAPGAAILAVLRRYAGQAPGLVTAAAARVGLPALHRALGAAGWQAVAESVRTALGTPASTGFCPTPDPGGVDALARALLALSRLAALIGRSGLRPPTATCEAWALLVAAAVDPSVLSRSAATAILGAVAGSLTGALNGLVWDAPSPTTTGQDADGTEQTHLRAPAGGTGDQTATVQARPRPDPRSLPDGSSPAPGSAFPRTPKLAPAPPLTAPADSGPEAGQPTPWAGLLFLLATATAAGIPAVVLDDPVFATRPLPWVLQGIALSLLPTECTDPAVAAFAGADPGGRAPWERGPTATPTERERIAELADGWAAVTATALGEYDGAPRESVTALARRAGHIHHAPGWTEVRLAVDEVDVVVRRAGLDLDPGWVPWLGTVVRFVYG